MKKFIKNFSFVEVALFCYVLFFLSILFLHIYLKYEIESCWFFGLIGMALSTLPVFFLQIKLLASLSAERKSTVIIFFVLLFPAAAFFASFAINELFGITYVIVDQWPVLSFFSSLKFYLIGAFLIYNPLIIVGLVMKAIKINKRTKESKNAESL